MTVGTSARLFGHVRLPPFYPGDFLFYQKSTLPLPSIVSQHGRPDDTPTLYQEQLPIEIVLTVALPYYTQVVLVSN